MTTEGREKVEVAVYKERTTTRDERILTHDESGQDTSNRPWFQYDAERAGARLVFSWVPVVSFLFARS